MYTFPLTTEDTPQRLPFKHIQFRNILSISVVLGVIVSAGLIVLPKMLNHPAYMEINNVIYLFMPTLISLAILTCVFMIMRWTYQLRYGRSLLLSTELPPLLLLCLSIPFMLFLNEWGSIAYQYLSTTSGDSISTYILCKLLPLCFVMWRAVVFSEDAITSYPRIKLAILRMVNFTITPVVNYLPWRLVFVYLGWVSNLYSSESFKQYPKELFSNAQHYFLCLVLNMLAWSKRAKELHQLGALFLADHQLHAYHINVYVHESLVEYECGRSGKEAFDKVLHLFRQDDVCLTQYDACSHIISQIIIDDMKVLEQSDDQALIVITLEYLFQINQMLREIQPHLTIAEDMAEQLYLGSIMLFYPQLAEHYLTMGDYENAEKICILGLQATPDNESLWEVQIRIHFALRRWEQLTQMMPLKPNPSWSVEVALIYISVALHYHHFDQALVAARDIYRAYPDMSNRILKENTLSPFFWMITAGML